MKLRVDGVCKTSFCYLHRASPSLDAFSLDRMYICLCAVCCIFCMAACTHAGLFVSTCVLGVCVLSCVCTGMCGGWIDYVPCMHVCVFADLIDIMPDQLKCLLRDMFSYVSA